MTTRRAFLYTTGLALLGLGLPPSLQAQSLASGERRHVVSKGETLSSIAQQYGISVATLKARNRLKGDAILIGQRLVIPGSRLPVPPSLAAVIAATRRIEIPRGRWRYVVAHHSGIEAGDAKAYDGAHRRRGMEHGLAYHFVIGNGRDSGDGEIEIGPRWRAQLHGGHVRNQAYNESGIGICMVGNFEQRKPGAKQLAAFTSLVDWLRNDAPLGTKPAFTVHRWVDRNHTVCPGRYFPYNELKKRYA